MRLILLLLSVILTACAHHTATQTPWHNFTDAWHLSNATTDVIVVPSIGRIMHFGPSASRNLLWAQPDAARYNKQYIEFDNYGGEKIWLWPQLTWPPAGDSVRYRAHYAHGILTLTSDAIAPHQVRIIREIQLHPTKPMMTIHNRLEPATPGMPPPRVALWSVAQLHLPERIEATLDRTAKPPFARDLGMLPAWPINALHNRTATFVRDPRLEAKSGLESSAIKVVYPQTTLRYINQSSAPGPYDPHTRAQLYVQADTFNTHPPHLPPYAEIEFLSPWPTAQTPWPTLTIRWSLE